MKKIIKIILILLLCLVFSLSVYAVEPLGIYAERAEQEEEEPEEDIDTLKEKRENLDETISSTYNQLGLVQSQMSEVLYEIEQLELQIIQKEEEIRNLENEETKVVSNIEVVEKTLEETNEKYVLQKKQLDERLVATYEMGQITYLDMLLKSRSLSEFLSNYYRISEIAQVDQYLLESFNDISAQVKDLSTSLKMNKKILEQSRAYSEEAKIVLENLRTIQNEKVDELSEEDIEIHKQIEEFQEELLAIESEIRLLSLTSSESEYIGGEFIWPTPRLYKNYISLWNENTSYYRNL